LNAFASLDHTQQAAVMSNAVHTVPTNSSNPSAPSRVLVVDDDSDTVETIGIYLRLRGYEVALALNGTAALETATAFQPHFVLLDLGMPKLDGYAVARQIRAQVASQPILVAMTGYADEEYLRRSREAGFDCYLLKPFGLDELIDFLVIRRDQEVSVSLPKSA
jgi:DNA-binding response OmpR family regulator